MGSRLCMGLTLELGDRRSSEEEDDHSAHCHVGGEGL